MLVNCMVYCRGEKLGDIALDKLGDYLRLPDHFVWVALRDTHTAELQQLQSQFGLHELVIEDVINGYQSPKIEEYGENVFVILQLIDVVGGEFITGEVNIFAGRNYVVSVRQRSRQGFSAVRARSESEPHLLGQGSVFVLYALIDSVIDRYFQALSVLEYELEKIEDAIFVTGIERANIERLYQLKRKLILLKHAVTPLMESIPKLYGGRVPVICSNNQEYFREVSEHLGRINSSMDTMQDTIGTAIQVNLSMVTIQQTDVSKRLAAWAAIFAVATAFAGIWGMNFDNMPELQWRFGYLAALATIGCMCGYLYVRFKKSGWL